MSIVIISHDINGKSKPHYVFYTDMDLNKGDIVACDTQFGKQFGVCITNTLFATGDALDYILEINGAKKDKMKYVVERYGVIDKAGSVLAGA